MGGGGGSTFILHAHIIYFERNVIFLFSKDALNWLNSGSEDIYSMLCKI